MMIEGFTQLAKQARMEGSYDIAFLLDEFVAALNKESELLNTTEILIINNLLKREYNKMFGVLYKFDGTSLCGVFNLEKIWAQ